MIEILNKDDIQLGYTNYQKIFEYLYFYDCYDFIDIIFK